MHAPKSRPGRVARLYTADKRQRSRARERDEMPRPKLSAAQRRVRALFREMADDLLRRGLLDDLIDLLRIQTDR